MGEGEIERIIYALNYTFYRKNRGILHVEWVMVQMIIFG